VCPDVQRIVRWVRPLLVACIAASCGGSDAGAPVDTPGASVGGTTELSVTSVLTSTTVLSSSTEVGTTANPVSVATVVSTPEQQVVSSQPIDAPPTTAVAIDSLTTPPGYEVQTPPEVSDASVLALAAVLGVDGEVEHMGGEDGAGQCIGRLEPRGLCVNVPLWGAWQYWDLDAQNSQGASDEQAAQVALDLFVRIGVDPGVVTSVEPNGPLPQMELSNGALVMVAQDGRIASVIAGTTQMPPG
jgi:hypothetical protein